MKHDKVVRPGDRIGDDYIVDRFLAGGGMGQVFIARDTRLDRLVAIKLLHAERGSQEAEARFQREAKALSRVVHPNVVGIHAFGRLGDGWYLAMEYVEGHSLHDQLSRHGPMSLPDVVSITRQVASGLAEAHAYGIIHRDIKPGNILLRRVASGALVAKVVDFGLARNFSDELASDLTAGTGVLGTPAYMSPEQIQNHRLDGRSDLYSLAVVVYQMITGRLPLYRDTVQGMLIAHLVDKVPPLDMPGIGERLPAAFKRELLRGLAKSPDERPPDVAAYAAGLERTAGLSQAISVGGVVECPACGHPSAEGGGYCSQCGSAVPLSACGACGTVRAGERYFCSGCGATLLKPARRRRQAREGDDTEGSATGLDRVTAAALVLRFAPGSTDAVMFSDYPQTFAAVVEREGGRPVAFLGNECIALFGLGGMREREIGAAIDASLALVAALRNLGLEGDDAPEMRVGIDVGLLAARGVGVAWGTAFAGGAAVESARAALNSVSPGEVGVGRRAMREVRGLYELREISAQCSVVERRRDMARSFADYKVHGLTVPLVGRDPELALLMRAARKVTRRPQLVVAPMIGPAGCGKTRLVAEFLRRLQDLGQGWEITAAACSPVGIPVAYEPFVDILRARLEPLQGADLADRLRQLPGVGDAEIDAQLTERRIRALSRILGADRGEQDDGVVRAASEDEQKAAFEAYISHLRAAANARPQVLVVEDLQWARDATLQLLDAVVKGCDESAMVIILPMRAERAEQLLGGLTLPRARTTTLEVPPFETDESAELVEELLGGLRLPEGMLDGVHHFADGVPARVEEAVDALIEDRVLVSTVAGWRFDEKRAAEKASLNASLAEMVLRRIGRLPPAERGLLHSLSVAGSFAPTGMVSAMVEREVTAEEFSAAVEAGFLVEAGRSRFAGEREFRIRQRGLSETLCENLPKDQRADLHRRAARWLRAWGGPRPAGFGAMLAHHFLVAGDKDTAAQYLLRTARDAMAAMANRDAFEAFGVVIEVARDLLERAPDSVEGAEHLVAGLLGRAEVALRIGELEQAVQAAHEASEVAQGTDRLCALRAEGEALQQLGRYEDASRALVTAISEAEAAGARGAAVLSMSLVAMIEVRRRDFEAAEVLANKAFSISGEETNDREELAGLGRLHLLQGHALARRGAYDEAMAHYGQTKACFQRLGEDIGAAMAELSQGNVAYRRQNLDAAARIYREVARRCRSIDYLTGYSVAMTNLGNVLLDQERPDEALKALRQAEKEQRTLGTLDYLPETLRLIALCLVGKGDTHGARTAASEATDLARKFGNEVLEQASVEVLHKARTLDESMTATTMAEGFADLPVMPRVGRKVTDSSGEEGGSGA